jgi:predicted DCC family thiol-disulfide oxidoreductase YuxK
VEVRQNEAFMSETVCFPLTIYYDAGCALCAEEMHALKRADSANRLLLSDCSRTPAEHDGSVHCGVTREAMMAMIHARDAKGRWLKGIEVFEAAYAACGYLAIARLYAHPRLRPWWDKCYPWIARHRYALSRCGLPALLRMVLSLPKRLRSTSV